MNSAKQDAQNSNKENDKMLGDNNNNNDDDYDYDIALVVILQPMNITCEIV